MWYVIDRRTQSVDDDQVDDLLVELLAWIHRLTHCRAVFRPFYQAHVVATQRALEAAGVVVRWED